MKGGTWTQILRTVVLLLTSWILAREVLGLDNILSPGESVIVVLLLVFVTDERTKEVGE